MIWYPFSIVLVLILSVALLLPSIQEDLTPDVRQRLNQLINFQKSWGPAMSTNGAMVTVKRDKPIARESVQGSKSIYTPIPYLIYTTGLPKNKTYQLSEMTFPDLNPRVQMAGIGLDPAGLVVCPGKPGTCSSDEGPDDPINLILPSIKGQVHHLVLSSEDGENRAYFVVTPFPIQSADKGCRLELQRVLPKAELVYVVASELKPGSEVRWDSSSLDEKHEGSGKADSSGNYSLALLPAVKGKDRGTLHVTVRAPGCSPSAAIDWGIGSDRLE